MLRVEQPRLNGTCLLRTKHSAGLKAGGGENRLNVIRQTKPTANERPEAESVSYTPLIAMLLS